MRTGTLQRTIGIATLKDQVVAGDVTQVVEKIEVVRAKVSQLIGVRETQGLGSRYLNYDELVDRAIFRIELWDNNYSNNIQIIIGNLVLHPIRPVTRERSVNSKCKEVLIIAATKVGENFDLNDDEMKYTKTVNLAAGDNEITTPLTTKPYSVELYDEDDNLIREGLLDKNVEVDDNGYYQLNIWSSDALDNVEIKFIY